MVGRRSIWGKFTNQADPSALVINYCFNLQVSKILSQAIINYLQLFKFSSKGNRGEGRGGSREICDWGWLCTCGNNQSLPVLGFILQVCLSKLIILCSY